MFRSELLVSGSVRVIWVPGVYISLYIYNYNYIYIYIHMRLYVFKQISATKLDLPEIRHLQKKKPLPDSWSPSF